MEARELSKQEIRQVASDMAEERDQLLEFAAVTSNAHLRRAFQQHASTLRQFADRLIAIAEGM